MPNLKEKGYLKLLSSVAGDKEKEVTNKDRAVSALKWGAIGLLGEVALRAALRKSLPVKSQLGIRHIMQGAQKTKGGLPIVKRRKIRYYAPVSTTIGALGSGAWGAFNQDLRNSVIQAKKDPSKQSDATKILRAMTNAQRQVPTSIDKVAFWGGIARGTVAAGKATAGGLAMNFGKPGGTVARKFFGMAKDAPFTASQRLFGLGATGGALYGGFKGGQAIYNLRKKHMTPYQTNYTAMLRNNMLAGNIQPGELSQEDIASVQRLGNR